MEIEVIREVLSGLSPIRIEEIVRVFLRERLEIHLCEKKRRGKEEKKRKSVELEEEGDSPRGKGENLQYYGII